ncbi:MAG TPA: hypothetical protein VGF28_16300 [Thermoanaerobaculia bacterium]|jgi:hypothetical protein
MRQDPNEYLELEQPEPGLSISDLAAIVKQYKTAILLVIGATAAFVVIASVATMLLLPSRRVTTLPFRLEFKGADRGEYPNGTKFSTSEVVSTPVLLQVYNHNSLANLVNYQTFKASIFITESNPALEALEREYRVKLADPKLTAVDRQRLEQEFEQKRASIARSEYSISYIEDSRLKTIPQSVKVKLLTDTLDIWASQTVANKGVVLYDLPILSSAIFERDLIDSYDYIIALDMVRAKIARIVNNIDQLAAIPGAKVVRAQTPARPSLAELRVRLEDALKFKIEPLVGMVLANGWSKNAANSIEFLQTRLAFNEIATREAEARVETLRQSLLTYHQFGPGGAGSNGDAQPAASPTGQSVIPQIDNTFIDRLVTLTSEKNDVEFRQMLVTEMRGQAMNVVPLHSEQQYYRNLIQSLGNYAGRARAADAQTLQSLRTQINAVVGEAVQTTDEVNQIYRAISRNLNPSTVLYSATAPALTTVETSVSRSQLLLAGILVLLLSTAAAVVGSLIHHFWVTARRSGDTDEVAASNPEKTPAVPAKPMKAS